MCNASQIGIKSRSTKKRSKRCGNFSFHNCIAKRWRAAQEALALENLQKEIDNASRSYEKAKIDFDNKIVAATAEAQRKTHAPAHLNSPKINECKRRLLFLQRGAKRGIRFTGKVHVV